MSSTELEFIITAAEGFNVDPEDYQLIRQFVLSSPDEVPESSQVLVIDGNRKKKYNNTRHIVNETFRGQVWFLNLPQADMPLPQIIRHGRAFTQRPAEA